MANPKKPDDQGRPTGAELSYLKPLPGGGPQGPGARPGSEPRQETMFQPGETPIVVAPPKA